MAERTPGSSAQPPAHLAALALEIYDVAMVVAPRGWQRVRARLERDARGAPRVAELLTTLGAAAAAAPLPKPALGIDAAEFVGVVNVAVAELLAAARVPHDRAAFVLVDRADAERATVSVLDAADAPALALALDAALLGNLVFTEALFDLLVSTEPAAEREQAQLDARIAGHDDWSFDQPACRLELAKGVLPWASFDAQVVGSYAHESATFLWAWGNEPVAGACTRRVTELRDQARGQRGLSALLRPSLPCEEGFAWTLARAAAVRMGAHGVYRANYGPGVLFLAVYAPAGN